MKLLEERGKALLVSAEKMAGGDVEHRAEISAAGDELDALAFAMNVIASELSYSARDLALATQEAHRKNRELAAAQETLVRKERLAALGQLAGGVAHQIRNPLAAVMNATAVLKRQMPPDRPADVDHALRIIIDEVRRANGIITGLLDYARVRTPTRVPTSLEELVEHVLEASSVPESVRVERTATPSCPPLEIDSDQLHDAVFNLVSNAIEAMPDGGSLAIDLVAKADGFVLAVTDSGPGISAEMMNHLFEPLYSTKHTGVGLGLVTARTLVEANGGHLVQVPHSLGARFEIRLPLSGD